MVGKNANISKLFAKGLRFGRAPKVVEKYWETESNSVCIVRASKK